MTTKTATPPRRDRDPLKWKRTTDVADLIISRIREGTYPEGGETPSVRALTIGAGDGHPMAMVTATAVNKLVARSGLVNSQPYRRAVVRPREQWPIS